MYLRGWKHIIKPFDTSAVLWNLICSGEPTSWNNFQMGTKFQCLKKSVRAWGNRWCYQVHRSPLHWEGTMKKKRLLIAEYLWILSAIHLNWTLRYKNLCKLLPWQDAHQKQRRMTSTLHIWPVFQRVFWRHQFTTETVDNEVDNAMEFSVQNGRQCLWT